MKLTLLSATNLPPGPLNLWGNKKKRRIVPVLMQDCKEKQRHFLRNWITIQTSNHDKQVHQGSDARRLLDPISSCKVSAHIRSRCTGISTCSSKKDLRKKLCREYGLPACQTDEIQEKHIRRTYANSLTNLRLNSRLMRDKTVPKVKRGNRSLLLRDQRNVVSFGRLWRQRETVALEAQESRAHSRHCHEIAL